MIASRPQPDVLVVGVSKLMADNGTLGMWWLARLAWMFVFKRKFDQKNVIVECVFSPCGVYISFRFVREFVSVRPAGFGKRQLLHNHLIWNLLPCKRLLCLFTKGTSGAPKMNMVLIRTNITSIAVIALNFFSLPYFWISLDFLTLANRHVAKLKQLVNFKMSWTKAQLPVQTCFFPTLICRNALKTRLVWERMQELDDRGR